MSLLPRKPTPEPSDKAKPSTSENEQQTSRPESSDIQHEEKPQESKRVPSPEIEIVHTQKAQTPRSTSTLPSIPQSVFTTPQQPARNAMQGASFEAEKSVLRHGTCELPMQQRLANPVRATMPVSREMHALPSLYRTPAQHPVSVTLKQEAKLMTAEP